MNKTLNRFYLLTSFLSSRTQTKGLPVEIGIELTNRCNLACLMCPHQEMVEGKIRPQGEMDEGLFHKIIDEIAPFAEVVYLHGLGESLLHPQIFEFIKYAKKKRLGVGLSTNATLLDKAKTEQLLNCGLDYLILAIDGATKETYEKIRKGANFEKVEANIKFFLEKKRQKKETPFCVLQFITMPENEQEVSLFNAKWQRRGADAVRIKPKISLKRDEKKKSPSPGYCFHVFRQLNIAWDGRVMACCEDVHCQFPLGSLQQQSLKEIWHGELMRQLREVNFRNQKEKIKICQNCSYPQPTRLQALGVLLFNHLFIKKMLPYWEKHFT